MTKNAQITLFVSRVTLGWLFLYAGITKVLNPEWTAKSYLEHAESFKSIYLLLAKPGVLPLIDFLNQWGLTLVGVMLIIGFNVKWASIAGIALMILYYFPILDFPNAGEHSFIVDDHIIYLLMFVVFIVFKAGRYWGLDGRYK